MTSNPVVDDRHTTPLRRLTEGQHRWRVSVETWPEQDEFRGRLLFRTDAGAPQVARESAAMLHGRSREEVLSAAHDIPDDRLRRVLHSLS
jgi:hypothetical protein